MLIAFWVLLGFKLSGFAISTSVLVAFGIISIILAIISLFGE